MRVVTLEANAEPRHQWGPGLALHLKVGDRVRVYPPSHDKLYSGTPHAGTIVGFKVTSPSASVTGEYDYDPVVVTDDGWRRAAFVTHYWASLGGRMPDPYRDVKVCVADSWVKEYDQTPNPDHAAFVESAVERAQPSQVEIPRPSLGSWLNDCCEPAPDFFSPNAHLFASWNVWAEAHHGPFMPEWWLPQALEDLGFRPGSNEGADGFFGLRFQDDVAEWVAEEAIRQAKRETERALERAATEAAWAKDRQGNAGATVFGLAGLAVAALVVLAVVKWALRTAFG